MFFYERVHGANISLVYTAFIQEKEREKKTPGKKSKNPCLLKNICFQPRYTTAHDRRAAVAPLDTSVARELCLLDGC